jgi:hypothetical protein
MRAVEVVDVVAEHLDEPVVPASSPVRRSQSKVPMPAASMASPQRSPVAGVLVRRAASSSSVTAAAASWRRVATSVSDQGRGCRGGHAQDADGVALGVEHRRAEVGADHARPYLRQVGRPRLVAHVRDDDGQSLGGGDGAGRRVEGGLAPHRPRRQAGAGDDDLDVVEQGDLGDRRAEQPGGELGQPVEGGADVAQAEAARRLHAGTVGLQLLRRGGRARGRLRPPGS